MKITNRILKFEKIILLVFLVFVIGVSLNAQEDTKTLLENLEEEDQKNIDALAMYPEDTRLAIFQASMYPEIFIKIDRIQSRTSSDFQKLMSEYPETTQREVWDLTRYPKLIHRLLHETNRNPKAIDNILSGYPKVIHDRAKNSLKNHYDLLKKIDVMNQTNETAFNNLLAKYDEDTQNAFRQLAELPEVMTVLSENIEVTILVGDAYKNDPDWVLQKADSIHLELARQNAQELEDWKKQIEENPEAAKELETSAKEFSEENGYDDLYYDYEEYDDSDDDVYYEDDRRDYVVERHYYHHYPYWYGYPTWYAFPRWRPYPYWYDWGFYFGSRRSIVIINMPSFYFVDWYFYHPYHHHHYPHLSAHFVNHYYGHRHSVGSVSTTVHRWQEKNRAAISDEMISNAPRNVNSFKEFGKMEEARLKYNNAHPQSTISQRDFVLKNKKTYPQLEKEMVRKEEFAAKGDRKVEFPIKDKERAPAKVVVPQKERKPRVIAPTKAKSQRTVKKVEKAKSHHKNTWERTKKTKTKVVPRARPKTRIKSSKPTKTRTKTKTKND